MTPSKKKPKKANEMTTDEAMARVFPKEVHEHLKRIAAGEKVPREKDTKW